MMIYYATGSFAAILSRLGKLKQVHKMAVPGFVAACDAIGAGWFC